MDSSHVAGASQDLHVIIVGAGTSGLLIAQGLKKNSIPFTIYESETSSTYQTRPREWGMTLHWGATFISSCLPPDLVSRFNEAYADPAHDAESVTGLPIYNGQTGELLMEMGGERPVRVSRKKMRNLFMEGIDVQYGKVFKNASVSRNDVEVEFEDGTTARGSILVGCDGAKSRVRETICGPEKAALTEVPVSMFNFPYKLPAELASRIRNMNSLFITSLHPDHGSMFWLSIQDVPDPSDPSTWTFQILQSWLDSTVLEGTDLSTFEGRVAFFKSRAAQYVEPWRSVGVAVDSSTKFSLDKATYWEQATPWGNRAGRMTLCGDAAHPMTPHRGQGLNNALMDSKKFVEAMAKISQGMKLSEAVDEYDGEVFARGKLEMDISLKQTMGIHSWESMMQIPSVKIGMRQAKADADN